jgi:hypothetical protein
MAIDVIFDPAPTAPSSTDKTNFRVRYDAFLAYIVAFVAKLISFVTQINALEANVNAKEASATAAAQSAMSAANYKGVFVQGTSTAAVGESWMYSGIIYKCNVGTSTNPVSDSTKWTSISIDAQIHAAPSKVTPVDADEFVFLNSVGGVWSLIKLSYAQLKASLFNSPALTGAPTAPTQASSDNSTKIATTAWVKLGFSYSLGTTGYLSLPTWMGGLIIQWSWYSGVTPVTITFPITYPTRVTTVLAIGDAGANAMAVVGSITFSNFALYFKNPSTGGSLTTSGYWFAIGY